MDEDIDELFMLVLSDMHVGSSFAPLPSGFTGSTGAIINFNSGQQYLLECWNHFLSVLPQKVDFLLLNGDIVHGQNKKQDARFLSEPDPQFQGRAAYQLLEPILARVREYMGVRQIRLQRGTPYHAGIAGDNEEFFGELIGSVKGPDGRRARPWLRLYLPDLQLLVDAAHRQSLAIRYQGMPLEREIGFLLESAGRARETIPSRVLIIRSHIHSYRLFDDDESQIAVSTPSWMLSDDFAQSMAYPNRVVHRLGAVGFFLTPGNIRAVRYPYKHPRIGETL